MLRVVTRSTGSSRKLVMERAAQSPVASGGNLFVKRNDLIVDTRLGSWSVGAVWNSATGEWLWSFDPSLKPTPAEHTVRFVDPSGYVV